MRSVTLQVAVPNSLLIIRSDPDAQLPEITRDASVWAAECCITLSCLPDFDGETTITIGPAQELHAMGAPLFDGRIATPMRKLFLQIVPGKTLLECEVTSAATRVRIWTDGQPDTDFVTIGLD